MNHTDLEVTVEDAAAVLVKVYIPPLDPDGDRPHVIRLLGRHELEDGVQVILRLLLRV